MSTELNVAITKEWQSVSVLSGVAVGTEMFLQYADNPSGERIYFREGNKPPQDSIEGSWIGKDKLLVTLEAGSAEYWFRSRNNTLLMHVRSY